MNLPLSRTFLTALSVLAVTASMLIGTNIATADQVQVQSYQRASQSEACAAQPGETPWQASWGSDPSWSPSYEMWANNGTGGWVCTRSITWARSTPSARTYALGDIGPGGGLVFLISGGLTYEMAPKTWSGSSSDDTPTLLWCNSILDITGATGIVIGTGSANTTAMQSPACTSGAGVSARAYRGGGLTDWFLPSQEELNAMCNYSRNPSAPAAPSVRCDGGGFPGTSQDAVFASGAYGFPSLGHWSSTQASVSTAWGQGLGNANGYQGAGGKNSLQRVRPIRAF